MSLVYGVICIVAFILLWVCIAVDSKKEIWLLLLFTSAFICDVGFFSISVSKTLNAALMSNRIVYIGSVFLPLFMLMMLLHLCKIKYHKRLPVILSVISFVIFLIAASPGILTIYYRTVSIEFVDGVTRLVREYGPLHISYFIYLFFYTAAMLLVVGYSIIVKKTISGVHGAFLIFAVVVNAAVWFAEQLLPRGFEFLSVSYVLSEAIVLFLYGIYQKYNMIQRIICVWTVAVLGVGIAMLCKYVFYRKFDSVFFNLIRSFIYIGMYYAWGRIACRGIIQRAPRRCLGYISALLIFWIIVSCCKHFVFADNATIVRYLWYAYYIPQILTAAFGLIMAIMVGKGENAKPGKWIWALLGAAFVLIVFVLTNDLHQLVFSFPEGQEWINEVCAHEFGYYFIMAVIMLCGVSTLIILVRKCRVSGRKKFAGFPFLCMAFMTAYWIFYFKEDGLVYSYLNDMSVVGCLLIAATFESIIECGLIQTNIGYDNLFHNSSIAAQITDYVHKVCYASGNAKNVPVEIMEAADTSPVMLDKSLMLSGAEIRGGHIYWQENVKELLSVQEKLEMIQAELRDTGDVLKALAEQKAYRLHLEEENKLYDLVETQTAAQVAVLRELTAELRQTEDLNMAKRLLGKIVIIGTYIKRRSNLIFVAGQEQSIPMEELLFCVNESVENLKLYGISCKARIIGCKRLSPEAANTVYDLFEAVVEKSMDTASAILLRVEMGNTELSVTVCADCTDDLTDLCRMFPNITVQRDEDGLWYLNTTVEKGGVCI